MTRNLKCLDGAYSNDDITAGPFSYSLCRHGTVSDKNPGLYARSAFTPSDEVFKGNNIIEKEHREYQAHKDLHYNEHPNFGAQPFASGGLISPSKLMLDRVAVRRLDACRLGDWCSHSHVRRVVMKILAAIETHNVGISRLSAGSAYRRDRTG